MQAAAPQQGAAMSLASKYGVRGESRRKGFPAWMPAGYCFAASNLRDEIRSRSAITSARDTPELRRTASMSRSPMASMSRPRAWSFSPSTVRIWYCEAYPAGMI